VHHDAPLFYYTTTVSLYTVGSQYGRTGDMSVITDVCIGE